MPTGAGNNKFTVSRLVPQGPVIVQTSVYVLSVPLVNVAAGLFALLRVAPLPIVIVHVPVCPAAGVLAARVAVVPVRESWSEPAAATVAGNANEI